MNHNHEKSRSRISFDDFQAVWNEIRHGNMFMEYTYSCALKHRMFSYVSNYLWSKHLYCYSHGIRFQMLLSDDRYEMNFFRSVSLPHVDSLKYIIPQYPILCEEENFTQFIQSNFLERVNICIISICLLPLRLLRKTVTLCRVYLSRSII